MACWAEVLVEQRTPFPLVTLPLPPRSAVAFLTVVLFSTCFSTDGSLTKLEI